MEKQKSSRTHKVRSRAPSCKGGFFNILLSPFNSHLTDGSKNGQGEVALSLPGLLTSQGKCIHTHIE